MNNNIAGIALVGFSLWWLLRKRHPTNAVYRGTEYMGQLAPEAGAASSDGLYMQLIFDHFDPQTNEMKGGSHWVHIDKIFTVKNNQAYNNMLQQHENDPNTWYLFIDG